MYPSKFNVAFADYMKTVSSRELAITEFGLGVLFNVPVLHYNTICVIEPKLDKKKT
jgi:hypothetical protein